MNTSLTQFFTNVKEYVKKNSTQLIILVISLLTITLIVTKLYYGKQVDKLRTENEIYILKSQLANQTKDSIINSQGKVITRQKAITTQDQDAINSISSENFQLKKKDEKNLNTIAYLKSTTETRIDTLQVPYTDTVAVNIKKKDSVALVKYIEDSTITIPRKASIETPDIALYQTITKTGVTLDSLKLEDSLVQRIVVKNNGWFKDDTYEFQSYHTNKLIKDKSQQSLIYTPKEKKGLLKYVISFVAGGAAIWLIKH